MLEQYRHLHTDQGQFDIDEHADGSYQIAGQELTFESWGQLTRSNEDGIVRADYVPANQPRKKKRAISPIEWKHLGKASTSNGAAKKKKKNVDSDGEEVRDIVLDCHWFLDNLFNFSA